MEYNYKTISKKIFVGLFLFLGLMVNAQDIHFTFANALNTNDGSFDYYEVDVMIQTINATGSFKLGSGQLYFNYNTVAFGTNVKAASAITVTQVNPNYICGKYVDAAAANIYGPFTTNDNTTSRVSWAFSQSFSSSTFAANNVNATPAKLCHLKFKYIDVNQAPMVVYEDGVVYDDQFYTACGLAAGGPFGAADCGTEPGIQLVNDTFDSGGAILSNEEFELFKGLKVYPNPASETIYITSGIPIEKIELYDTAGKLVLESKETLEVNLKHLDHGLYLLKLYSENAAITKKLIIE